MKRLSPPTSIPDCPVFHEVSIREPELVPAYHRDLPHLRVEGATYFTTFRLADSIPQSVINCWKEQRHAWLRSHGVEPSWAQDDPPRFAQACRLIPHEDQREFEREQARKAFVEMDQCHGSCVLAEAHEMVAAALEYFHGQRVWIGDYVVMPNHVHGLVQPFPGVHLEEWLYSVKRFASTRIMKQWPADHALRSGHLWQIESFDRIVRDTQELSRTRLYIARNPMHLRPGTFALKSMDWLDECAPPPKTD